MSSLTPNYGWILPGVNDPTDQDLWGGYLNSNISSQDTIIKQISDAAAAAQLPVGSIYINKSVATNPGTLLGYGTWVAITDRFLVAVGSTFTPAGSTGGASSVTISASNLPSLTGTVNGATTQGAGSGNSLASTGTGSGTIGVTVNSGSANTAISTNPPYLAVYIWERTV